MERAPLGYGSARFYDFMDIFEVNAGVDFTLDNLYAVVAMEPVAFGGGYYNSAKLGMDGRIFGHWKETRTECNLFKDCYSSFAKTPRRGNRYLFDDFYAPFKSSENYKGLPFKEWALSHRIYELERKTFDITAELYFCFIGLDVGFSPQELLDFVAGIFTYDRISNDDWVNPGGWGASSVAILEMEPADYQTSSELADALATDEPGMDEPEPDAMAGLEPETESTPEASIEPATDIAAAALPETASEANAEAGIEVAAEETAEASVEAPAEATAEVPAEATAEATAVPEPSEETAAAGVEEPAPAAATEEAVAKAEPDTVPADGSATADKPVTAVEKQPETPVAKTEEPEGPETPEEPAEPPLDPMAEYEKRLKLISFKDPEQLYEHAIWCQENSLPQYMTRHLRQTIALNPNHAEARKMLSYVKLDGKWILKDKVAD